MSGLLTIFRALADPTRLRIIALLQTMELAIGELAIVLEQSQPRVSRHVRILAEAGLIERHREGSWVFLHSSTDPTIKAMIEQFSHLSLSPREDLSITYDARRLAAVRAERAAAAQRYFAEHAAEWDAIRSRHIAETQVEDAIIRMMSNHSIGHLLDIGTGTGRMAEILAASAQRVTALDRSPEMLRIARARLANPSVRTDLVQGDFMALPLATASIDTVIMHQVLHFAHEPDRATAEAARVLRDGGLLLIADFADHNQEDLRKLAAHIRLGFSDAQIRGWFAANRLLLENVQTLDGGQLTVKLWLGRRSGERCSEQDSQQDKADTLASRPVNHHTSHPAKGLAA